MKPTSNSVILTKLSPKNHLIFTTGSSKQNYSFCIAKVTCKTKQTVN